MIRGLKSVMVLLSLALLLSVSAQEDSDSANGDGNGARRHRGKMADSSAMCGVMMLRFMKPSAAFETSDGFIIIVGNKIMKYDNDLNLVRDVKIEIDTTALKEMIQKMHQCPMRDYNGNGGEKDTTHADSSDSGE